MNTVNPSDFGFSFLEEGFTARDVVEQKINETSMTVSLNRIQLVTAHMDNFWK